jgi:hypothetical protein
MSDLLLPARKGEQQEALSCTEKSNFGLHFWGRVTLVKLVKYGNWGYLAWRVYFWGKKRHYTFLKVYLIASIQIPLVSFLGQISNGQSSKTPPGLPRGRPRQGEDPQVHVHVVAHKDPEGKPHQEHQQQQRPAGQAGQQVPHQARGGVPGRGAQGNNQGHKNDVAGHQLQSNGRRPSPLSTSPRRTGRRPDCMPSSGLRLLLP